MVQAGLATTDEEEERDLGGATGWRQHNQGRALDLATPLDVPRPIKNV